MLYLLNHTCLNLLYTLGFCSSTGKIYILMNDDVRIQASEFLTESTRVTIQEGGNLYWLIEDPKGLKQMAEEMTSADQMSKRQLNSTR